MYLIIPLEADERDGTVEQRGRRGRKHVKGELDETFEFGALILDFAAM